MHKLTFVEGKEPTCTEPGSLEYWTCSDCGKNFADVYASKEISDITIPTKEHTPGEAATCTEPQTCTVCGEVIAPKTEHHYENGYCVDCGEKELIPSEGLEFALLGNCYAVTGIGTCTDTDVVIPSVYNGLPVTVIGWGAFGDCDGLTSITIPNSVTSIGSGAFYSCSDLTSITIPDGVTSIGWGAFWGCESLTSVTIGDGVTSIGMGAFAYCESLTSIVVSEGNQVYHSAGNCIIETSSGTLIAGCNNSVIPNDGSVTSIGYCAFYGCESLTSITIPDSVTVIEDSAFEDCYSLTSITIGSGVTSIGEYAFYRCTSLTSVTIPNSVTSIGASAFSGCDNLTTVYYAGTKEQWNEISIGEYNEELTEVKILFKGEW